MKTNRIYILIVIQILLTASCCNHNEGSLEVVDSLGWKDSCEMNLGIYDAAGYNGNLLLYDNSHRVFVYDSNDYAFIRTIGREGKGPGELSLTGQIMVFDDTVYISDIGNNRISKFNISGNYESSINAVLPYELYKDNGQFSFTQFYAIPDCKHYFVERDSVMVKHNLGKLFDDAGIDKLEREHSIIMSGNDCYIAFTQYKSNLFKLNEDDNTLIAVPNLFTDDKTIRKSYLLNIEKVGERIFAVHTFLSKTEVDIDFEKSNSEDIKRAFGIREYLCEYDSSFNLIKYRKIPDRIYTVINTMVVDNGYIHIQDSGSQLVYKLKM